MSKQKYWYKVTFGKWEDDTFDPESSFVFIESWSVPSACKKAEDVKDEDEVIVSVEYLGYPQT